MSVLCYLLCSKSAQPTSLLLIARQSLYHIICYAFTHTSKRAAGTGTGTGGGASPSRLAKKKLHFAHNLTFELSGLFSSSLHRRSSIRR